MSTNITYSSDLMTNYLQAELIAPQKKFEAYQTSDGRALLFSIDTGGQFYVTEQTSGQSKTGWSMHELSGEQTKSGGTINTFDAAQSATNGTISVGMSLAGNEGDTLYLSMGNSNLDTSWITKPSWTAFPYDDAANPVSKLEIVNIFFCETSASNEYIIVDIVRDPASAAKTVHRYYIDPTKASGQFWNSHDIAFDLSTDNYQTAIGRLPNGYVDGTYTGGNINGVSELYFTPVINVFGKTPPSPTRLAVTDGGLPDALATTRNSDASTDLWVVSGNTLYYYAAAEQKNDYSGVAVVTNDLLNGATKMSAMSHDGQITLWIVNGSDEVFYLTVPHAQINDAGAWNTPVPILSKIETFSAYVNAVDGGNTIFAEGGGQLYTIIQNPASGIWHTQHITLPVPTTTKSLQIKSYTTTIQINGDDGLPNGNQQVSLSANTRSGVYVNNIYYVLSPTPVHINANSSGAITIINATEDLNCAKLSVSLGAGTSVEINPMDKPFQKAASLGSKDGSTDALSSAKIDLGNGKSKPLVPSGESDGDLKTVSAGLYGLKQSYTKLSPQPATTNAFAVSAPVTTTRTLGDSFGDDLMVGAGDIYNWLKSGVDAVVEIIEDAANDVWHFVAKIAGKVYRAILDTVDAVVGAVQWLYNAIKTAIKDLILFLEFLFEWDSIKRTKEVLHNLVKQFLQGQIDSIDTFREAFDTKIAEAETAINGWAGITDWSPLGEHATKTPNGSADNPLANQTSGSQLLSHHMQNNAGDITIQSGAPVKSALKDLLDDLVTAIEQEASVLGAVLDQIQTLAHEFSSLSLADILKRIIGILADGVLSSAQVVVDAFLKILKVVAQSALDILDAKLHIPVVSDILNDLGIPDISFLDLFCWVGGLAFTVTYKIAKGAEPFPDNSDTDLLINANSIDQLQNAFGPQGAGSVNASMVKLSESAQTVVYILGHATGGFMAFVSDFITTFEAADTDPDNMFSTPSAVVGFCAAASVGIANFLVPMNPIKNTAVSVISSATTGLTILGKIIFSSVIQDAVDGKTGVLGKISFGSNARSYGAIYNAVMIIPALCCTVWHFCEIAEEQSTSSRTAAILDETSNLCSYISRLCYTIAVNDDDEESRVIIIGVMAVANIGVSGLQLAESAVEA